MQKPRKSSVLKEVPPYAADGSAGWHLHEDAAGRNLRERTTKYAGRIIRLSVGLPKTTLAQVPGKQFLRSGTSVGANYRECCRGRSKAESIAKLGGCLKELDETACRLELLSCDELVPAPLLTPFQDETWQLTAIFVASMNRAKSPD